MFHLAVVLEEGNVVGRGQAQHTVELVVHLDRYLADTRREKFLCQLP
jgi:hypothetical protein